MLRPTKDGRQKISNENEGHIKSVSYETKNISYIR